ncbi:DUF1345 domain-containing protein [uncultured Pseudokineococcus sp.]|uniref:DUF1345 domain-containing protein n=1 Tax=uncultured Pseudokineococcus sp. TaxID=1642928 RepID=UPI00260236E0|nr:DUF1345 domain-containing protein [uncultured Pseudokineococcus sp.]
MVAAQRVASRQPPTWWHTDVARWYAAAGSGLALAVALQPLRDDASEVPLVTYRWVLCYAVTMLVFSALTVRAFSRHREDNASKDITGRMRTPTRRDLVPGSLAAMIALAVALWYVPYAGGLPSPLAQLVSGACAVLLVVAAWITMTVSFAVVYARREQHVGGLDVPGRRGSGFTDHLYLAVAVSATLGTTDVAVRDRGSRGVVLVHSVLAFTFSTVVLALLVTSLAV